MSIYLDHNATAVPLPAAADAAAAWLRRPANPSSVHGAGRAARAAVERARRQVAAAIGGRPSGVVFTSGATEALHLALGRVPRGAHVVASAVEHPAVFGACAARGVELTRVPVDGSGCIDVAAVAAAVRPDTGLVAVMAAQNELGNVYPIAEIARAVAPVPLLCDAVQAVGKIAIDVTTLGAAMVALSGHKIGAPSGVGALYIAPGEPVEPNIIGGAQERGRRGGTENVPGIIGLGVAAEHVEQRLRAMAGVAERRQRLREALAGLPEWVEHGRSALPNTLAGRVDGIDGDILLAAMDREGVHLSSGAACAAGGIEPSPVLLALGLAPAAARGGLRFSLGPETTDEDIERVGEVFVAAARRALAVKAGARARSH